MASCEKLQSCSSFALSVEYGDVPTCESRVAAACAPTFNAPGTSATPAKTNACAASIPSLACADVIAGKLGTACTPTPGTVANGGTCGDNAQCTSTFCAISPTSICGTCAAPTTAGGACVNQACTAGQACPPGQTNCVAVTPGAVGAKCSAQAQCDLANAVGCNTSTMQCTQLALAGATCGVDFSGGAYDVCPKDGSCSAISGGMCMAAAADGQTCSTAAGGTQCVPPAKCVSSKCVIPDPTTCH